MPVPRADMLGDSGRLAGNKPRLLILNWRDPQNPRAGGAEKLTMEWATAWSEAGLEVTWLSNAFEGSSPEARLRDIRLVRRGRPHDQFWHARAFDQREGPFDLVVEEI